MSIIYTQNPVETSSGVPVYISTSAVRSTNWLMVSATGRDAPLLIIGMYRKQIGQSTVLPGALNTITITIATTDPLYESRGAAVHLYGLTGTNTQDGSLAIRGEDALSSAMFQTQAEWTQSDGHLIILLAGTSSGYQSYILSFDLRNPTDGQESPSVSIEVTPYPLIHLVGMDSGPDNKAPLLVAQYWYTPMIGQSTSSPSNWALGMSDQTNTISVTVSVSMQLTASPTYGGSADTLNCSFTVKGLLPMIAGSGTLTAVTSSTQVALDTRASTTNNAYAGFSIRIRSQFTQVVTYVGLSRAASLSVPLAFAAVAYVDRYILYNSAPEQIPIQGSTTYLGTSAVFDTLNGLLTGHIVQDTPNGTDLVFSFDVKNPPEGRYGSTVSITVCQMPWIAMQSAPGNGQPGLVAVSIFQIHV